MNSCVASSIRMLARRVVGVALIAACYLITFLLLVALSDPFSPTPSGLGNGTILTTAAVMAAPVWAASRLIIRKFMLYPKSKAAESGIPAAFASILLLVIPVIFMLLVRIM